LALLALSLGLSALGLLRVAADATTRSGVMMCGPARELPEQLMLRPVPPEAGLWQAVPLPGGATLHRVQYMLSGSGNSAVLSAKLCPEPPVEHQPCTGVVLYRESFKRTPGGSP